MANWMHAILFSTFGMINHKDTKKKISFTPHALLIKSVSRPVHDTDRKQNGNALVDLLQEVSVIF